MADLLTALDAPPSGRSRATWFDSLAYCRAKLMSYGPVPWDSPGEVAAFFGKAQGMFRSDALLVDLGDLLAWRVGHDGLLRTAMAARSRPGYALRILLGDEQARAVAAEAVTAVAASAGAVPVVLSAPSPARWLAVAAAQAGAWSWPWSWHRGRHRGGAARPGPRRNRRHVHRRLPADLRRPGRRRAPPRRRAGLRRRADPPGGLPPGPQRRGPLRVARADQRRERPGVAVRRGHGRRGVARVSPRDPKTPKNPGQAAGRWGIVASTEFWHGTDPPAAADLVLAAVPADADPDTVMQRVRALSAEP